MRMIVAYLVLRTVAFPAQRVDMVMDWEVSKQVSL
jgi:hypothetical protein